MKKTSRLLAALLLFVTVFSFSIPANAMSASKNTDATIDYYGYIENVLPRYLSTENSIRYGTIKVSDPIEIINGSEEHGRMFFITNNGSYIGQLAVTYGNGSFHSSFMFDSDEYIDTILSTNTPFTVVAYEDDLVIKTAQDSKMLTVGELPDEINTYSVVEYYSVDFVTVDIENAATRELPSEEYYVSLAVPQVDNDTVNGEGLCWAAAVASVSNYRKDTSYDAMDIYDALDELYSGTPAGTPTWYSRAYSYCNMSYTYTNPMEFVDLYDALDSKDRPVIFRVRRSENGSYIGHAVVLRYLCGGNEYTTYGFVDPNKTNTVYVDFYSPTCDPDEFEYYNGSRTYPDWIASIY